MSFNSWSATATLGDLLVRSANRFGSRKAIVFSESEMTYAELLDGSVAVARGIIGLGIAPRSHIGLLANNGHELVTGLFGAWLANCVAVPLNARHKAHELGFIIDNSQIVLLLSAAGDVTHVDFRDNIASALPSLACTSSNKLELPEAAALRNIVLLSGKAPQGFMDAKEFAAAGDKVTADDVDHRRRCTKLRDIATIIYTSGTTANPKGCMLTHEAMSRGPVERAEKRFRSGEYDVTWGGGPLFHIGSLAPFIGSIGASGTYLTDTFFNPERAVALMARNGVTAMWPWFPAILQPLLDQPNFVAATEKLRSMLLIGPETLVNRVQQFLPQAEIMQACGMTETAGIFALSDPDETPTQRATSNGKAVPGIELRIVDERGFDVPPNAVGEVLVRGYCVMEGYYRDKTKSAEALDKDGWLHTGDLYTRSTEGRLVFHGRAKDMLKVGGENVAAIEVEAFLCSHPAVRIAEIVGRPDQRLDEVPVAFVELMPGTQVSADDLIAHCKGRIAGYKVPRAVYFLNAEDWPMSATKVNKRALRAWLAELAP
ncbi:class I adenylate-forming enzyme family protein [Sphingorhabdus sp.]|jgi:acyl-CoA synthetase (AMP-forming)/AMP-acid ligase II|uniref:class I adenylate-forming enzyme family protein n=1 Tax=Sphingorhabdus sp. TaxID=1902408 RepID=UPI0037CA6231